MTETQKLIKALKSGRAQVKTIQGQTVIQFKPVKGQIKRTVKISTSRTYSTSTPKISAKAPMKVKKIKAISTKTQAEQLYQKRYDKAMYAARRLPAEAREQYAKTKMAAYKSHKASMVSVKKTMMAFKKGGVENTIYHLKNIENWLKDNVGGTARNTLSANIGEWIDRGDLAGTETMQKVVDRLNSTKEISNSQFKQIRQLIYSVSTGTADQNEVEVQLNKILAE
jgi:hypothetical protein